MDEGKKKKRKLSKRIHFRNVTHIKLEIHRVVSNIRKNISSVKDRDYSLDCTRFQTINCWFPHPFSVTPLLPTPMQFISYDIEAILGERKL